VAAEVVVKVLLPVLHREVMRPVKNLGHGNRFVAGRGAMEEAGYERWIEDEILNQNVGAVVMARG